MVDLSMRLNLLCRVGDQVHFTKLLATGDGGREGGREGGWEGGRVGRRDGGREGGGAEKEPELALQQNATNLVRLQGEHVVTCTCTCCL